MIMVSPGRLDQTVIVEEAVETQNDFGETVRVWQPIAGASERRAAVVPLTFSDQERLANSETVVQQEITHKVVMRYWPGLTAKNRLTLGSRILEIQAVADVEEAHRMYEILCREAVDG